MALTLAVAVAGCANHAGDRDAHAWVATIPPLADIIRQIAGDGASVITLLPAGASPHSYSPKPSDVAAVERARAVFYIAPNLDGWIVRHAPEAIAVLPMLPEAQLLPADPEHGGGGTYDPHFWTDPALMQSVVAPIAEAMTAADPARAAEYRHRAVAVIEHLTALDAELDSTLAPVRGRAVMLVHPSLAYFLRRYGIPVAGYVEPKSGVKPSPQDLKHLIDTAQQDQVRAVFSEVQLPRRAIAAIAESLQLPLYELDPLGGMDGRDTYEALMKYNADIIRKGLQ